MDSPKERRVNAYTVTVILRCGHSVVRDYPVMPGLGVFCTTCNTFSIVVVSGWEPGEAARLGLWTRHALRGGEE